MHGRRPGGAPWVRRTLPSVRMPIRFDPVRSTRVMPSWSAAPPGASRPQNDASSWFT
ncbi:hypothetical protein [Sorangium sp. So ce590]|uniref:hypothetical protein n=1 Tax=unclassified Sorangium TaxID=2621164 RepID=UPI003F60CBC2